MAQRAVDFRTQARHEQTPAKTAPNRSETVCFSLRTVTPVHIGCDEVYEPTSFVIDAEKKELVSFATADFLERLDSDALAKFSEICKKGTIVSLLELFKFMRSQANLVDGQRVAIPPALVEHYESTLKLPLNENRVKQELNSFQIKRTAFDPLSGTAYIPGSAIKGAIRTAVLNLRNQENKAPFSRTGRELQEKLLSFDFRHLESDPFRLIKVSDFFPVNDVKRAIVYAVDQKKKISDKEAQAVYQILETVTAGVEFVGSVTILANPGRDSGIQQPITMKEVTTALRSFYSAEKQREEVELAGIGCKAAELVIQSNVLPLRIGRHSGAESVTIAGHRKIKILQGRGIDPKFLDHATTIWLAAGVKKPTVRQNLQPFGWVQFEPLAADSGQQGLNKASAQKRAALSNMETKIAVMRQREEESRARQEEEKRMKAEKAAQLAAEKAEQEAAAARERQALAAMSEADRIIYLIQQANTSEETLDELVGRLETLPIEEQEGVAVRIRSFWETENKWVRRHCVDNQWKRVKKVRAILEPANEEMSLDPEDQAAVEQIKALADWGAWKNKKIDMQSLPLPAQKALLEKFNQWNLKKVPGEKRETHNALTRLLRQR